jgi:hypothetical protein
VDISVQQGLIFQWCTSVTGLLSLASPAGDDDFLRSPESTVFLTVKLINAKIAGADDNDTIIAGARIPMTFMHFPQRFRLSMANLLPLSNDLNPQSLEQTIQQSDLLVEANICQGGTGSATMSGASVDQGVQNICSLKDASSQVLLQATGVAKLLRLPITGDSISSDGNDEQLLIRAPVTLILSSATQRT